MLGKIKLNRFLIREMFSRLGTNKKLSKFKKDSYPSTYNKKEENTL